MEENINGDLSEPNPEKEIVEDKSGSINFEDDLIKIRKEKIVKFVKERYNLISYAVLAFIVFLAVRIRTRNLSGLRDITTGTWTLGPDLDPFLFLRWAKEIVANGSLFAVDMMRYSPLGLGTDNEYLLHPYMMAWFHKVASIFGSESVTHSAVLYPVFFFAITVVAFFLMTRKIFVKSMGGEKANVIALIASFFLSVIPSLLPRTIAGIPEKESAAFFFLFIAFYFFLSAWQSKKMYGKYVFAVLAGMATAGMAHVWGGYIFIFFTIMPAVFIAFMLGKVRRKEIYVYSLWLLSSFALMVPLSARYTAKSLITSVNTGPAVIVLIIMVAHFLIFNTKLKRYFESGKLSKIPPQIVSAGGVIILAIILSSVLFGVSFIPSKIAWLVDVLVKPATSRLIQTVAENKQPYFTGWANNFGPSLLSLFEALTFNSIKLSPKTSQFFSSIPLMFWLFFAGSIYLLSKALYSLDKGKKRILTLGYGILLFSMIFSRYSGGFIGENSGELTARNLYLLLGTISLFLLFWLYLRNLIKTKRSGSYSGYFGAVSILLPLIALIGSLLFGNRNISYLLNGENNISILIYSSGFLLLLFLIGGYGIESKREFKWYNNLYGSLSLLLFIFIIFNSNLSPVLNGILGVFLAIILVAAIVFSLISIARQHDLKKIDFNFIFLFSFFFLTITAARSAVRTIMLLVPPAAIISSYFVVSLFDWVKKSEKNFFRVISWIVFGVVLMSILFAGYGFYKSVNAQAQGYVPSIYTHQWQKAMGWVRENTPEDAVFGHWWDYGYWLQSIGERATVLDGGNNIGYWNHLMGRHALTGTDNRDALEFLYAHNTTHFLIDSTDIGKYGAFSSIGSNADYDRTSYISTFFKDVSQTQEKKDSFVLFYRGGAGLDEDIIYEEGDSRIFLPKGRAVLGAVLVERNKDGTISKQPIGVFVDQGQQYQIPFRYAFDGELIDFGSGLESGVYLFPRAIQSGGNIQIENDGALFYLSKRTVQSQLARLYLYGENSDTFRLVHTEDDFLVAQIKSQNPGFNSDFIHLQGLRGPIKIWEINYPSDIEYKEEYKETTYPSEIKFAR